MEKFIASPKRTSRSMIAKIYLMWCEQTHIFKIGYTRQQPTRRLKDLSNGCPYKLKLIAAIDGSMIAESNLLRKYSKYKMHGEWFEFPTEVAYDVLEEFGLKPDQQFQRLARVCEIAA